jgi:hypothetical protein
MPQGRTAIVNGDQRIELKREELYELVWTEPIIKLARQYGLSDRGLAKICDRMGIPVPGRGYWAKVQSGKSPPQAKLTRIKAGQQSRVVLSKNAENPVEDEKYGAVSSLIASEALLFLRREFCGSQPGEAFIFWTCHCINNASSVVLRKA